MRLIYMTMAAVAGLCVATLPRPSGPVTTARHLPLPQWASGDTTAPTARSSGSRSTQASAKARSLGERRPSRRPEPVGAP